MSNKFRVSMDMDFSQIVPGILDDGNQTTLVREAFTSLVLHEARNNAKRELHNIRRNDEMDSDVKTICMAAQLRKIMATLLAESNLTVEPLTADHPISTELPFERKYRETA